MRTMETKNLKTHPVMELQLPSTGGELTVLACCFIVVVQLKTLHPGSDLVAALHPIDHSRGPAHAPPDLRDEESGKVLFVEAEKLDGFFDGPVLRCAKIKFLNCSFADDCWVPAFRSLQASIGFQTLHPFLNPSNFPADKVILGDYRTVVWPNPKENAVCAMFGAVYSCNLIHPGYFGSHHSRAIGIIPTFDALYNFQKFLRNVYALPDLYAPLDYGCILSFASRREGLTSPCMCLIVFSPWLPR
jgi:hypothetical protein